MEYRARYIGDSTLRLMTNQPIPLDAGEVVLVSIDRARSPQNHKHQFAWIKDAWGNLPESALLQPWAETPETLRKHALIATGYHQTLVLDCGANATAQRVKTALLAAEVKAHGYALGQVRGPVVRIWTPESQSVRSMGGDRFKASKAAILDWIASQMGVAPDELKSAGA